MKFPHCAFVILKPRTRVCGLAETPRELRHLLSVEDQILVLSITDDIIDTDNAMRSG